MATSAGAPDDVPLRGDANLLLRSGFGVSRDAAQPSASCRVAGAQKVNLRIQLATANKMGCGCCVSLSDGVIS